MLKNTHTIKRKTNETDINLKFGIHGTGKSKISTGIGFFDHMLDLFTHHGQFDVELKVTGDLAVDFHHTVEDVGICLGQAFRECIQDGAGMSRYASGLLPMDESLCEVAVDISNRSTLIFDAVLPKQKVGEFDVELAEEFFRAFVSNARITLHITLKRGDNLHHILESMFKGVGRFLGTAARPSSLHSGVPSTKGIL